MSQRCVIVGASLAGVAAAEAIREEDADAEIIMIGAEPHPPYDRPPLSKELLQGTREPDELTLRDASWADELSIDLRLGQPAVALETQDRRLALAEGETVAYDRLLIATGATPRRLPMLESVDGVHLLRTLDDAVALRAILRQGRRLVVIGGGFIGLEVAASARRTGVEVTVLEALETVLAGAVGPQVGAIVGELHAAHGVDVRTGAKVAAPVVADGRVAGVQLSDGEVVAADAVVVGVGVRPATDWIKDPRVEVDDGVLVDSALRSSAPAVFAAGDVARVRQPDGTTRRVEHWTTAVEQGRHAGRNMVRADGALEPLDEVPSFWSDQYDAKIRSAGTIPDPQQVHVVEDQPEPLKLVALALDGDVLAGVITIGRASALAKCRPLLEQPGSAAAARALVGARDPCEEERPWAL